MIKMANKKKNEALPISELKGAEQWAHLVAAEQHLRDLENELEQMESGVALVGFFKIRRKKRDYLLREQEQFENLDSFFAHQTIDFENKLYAFENRNFPKIGDIIKV